MGILFLYALQRVQGALPLNGAGLPVTTQEIAVGPVASQIAMSGVAAADEFSDKDVRDWQAQLGRVAAIWEMMNWCIRNPLEGKPFAADEPRLIALQA